MPDDPAPARLLIVDDDAGLARLMEKTLRREGHETALAGSGKDVLAWLAEHQPDLMLLDLKLTDIRAPELVRQLAAAGRMVPFVVVTGQGDERAAVEMMQAGALDYLVKDTRLVEILPAAVRRALTHLQQQHRLELAERQARLGLTVLQQMQDAVVITSAQEADPEIHYCNPAFAAFAAPAKHRPFAGLRLGDLEKTTGPWELFHRALATRQNVRGEARLRDGQGRARLFDCAITSVHAHNQDVTHWAALLHDVTDRRQLERDVLDVTDREMSRLGRDLHDSLGQQLIALELFTTGLAAAVQAQAPKLLPAFQKMGRHLRDIVGEARALSHGLAPPALESQGLVHALGELAESTRAMTGIRCLYKGARARTGLPPTVAMHLYRIAQEAVGNALKHGHPKNIALSLRAHLDVVTLVVADDGQGFDPEAVKNDGMGLRAMQYRAELIDAKLDIESRPRQGTRVTCIVRAHP